MKEIRVLGCPLNLSEGRSWRVIEEVVSSAGVFAAVLDVSRDPDHNRTVLTLAGTPARVVEAALAAVAKAVKLIDLTEHQGVHPRMGAVDVIPFTPYRNSALADAVDAARTCASRLWDELGVPSFLYEAAASDADEVTLPWVRRHAFKDLSPSFGSSEPHATAGACAVGAREALVAFNVNLQTENLEAARSIASALRSGKWGRLGVRALGLPLASRGQVQVSMNLTKPETTPALPVLRAVEELASGFGISVADTEFVGLVPMRCLGDADTAALKLREPARVLESELDRACSLEPLAP